MASFEYRQWGVKRSAKQPLLDFLIEYEGTSHLLADGVEAPRLMVRIVNLQACERGSP